MSPQRLKSSAKIAYCGHAYANICAALLSLGVLSSVAPVAQEVGQAETTNCIERSSGVTNEMLDCLANSYKTVDGALNHVWSALLPSLDDAQQGTFRDAQRDWIEYRDSTCAAEASFQAGSFSSIALADCRLRLSIERLNWLKDLHPDLELADLWRSVESAADPHAQEEALCKFLAIATAQSSEPLGYSMTATPVNGEHSVPIGDKALFDAPFEHQLSLSFGGKTYSFRPRSKQIIALLLRE